MKKKLLSIILMAALVLTMTFTVVACNKNNGEAVTAAADAFRKAHISDTYDKESYDLAGSFTYEKATYTITWTSDKNTVKFDPSADGKTVKVTVTKTSAAQEYKLTATLSDGEGNTATAEFKGSIAANANADGNLGKTYKLAIRQLTKGTVLYAKAEVAAIYYLGAATVATDGADFYTEDVTGGKKIFTMIGVNKCYLGAKISDGHNNICLGGVVNDMSTSYEGSVWTISDDEIKTTVDGKTLYLGTYGDKTTFSVSEYKTYPAVLVEKDATVTAQAIVSVSDKNENSTVTITSPTPVDGKVIVDVGTSVTFTVTPADNYEIVSVKNGVEVLEAANGVYSVTVNAGVTIVVDVRLVGSNGATSPVSGEIDNAIPMGWTYITNNEKYPDPAFYGGSTKGLKVNYANIGISSPELDGATGDITVKVNIYALNAGAEATGTNTHIFKVEGLDAAGEVVVTGYIDTYEIGYSNQVVLNASTATVKKIRVILEERPIINGKGNNVNLGGVTITWGAVDNSVAKIGETGYETLDAAITAAQANDTIVLNKNVVVTTNVVVSKKITLDLNGKTISNTADIWNDTDGIDIWSLISVRANGELTITGNGKLDAKKDDCYAVDVRGGGKLVIENGEFIGNISAVYVLEGSAEIKGGKYDIKQLDNVGSGRNYTLNLEDAHGTAGTAAITVTGGSFVEYDPSHSNSENPEVNFVATGYVANSSTSDGKTVYTVSPSN